MVREQVHPLPVDGGAVVEPVNHFLDFGQVYFGGVGVNQVPLIDLLVAEHTGLYCGNGSGLAGSHVSVAKLALDTDPALFRGAGVYRVRKGDGLRRGLTQTEGRIGKPGDKKNYH
jgi:hypothetical protein